ncbi:MAG: nucleotidyl transferase AbiEii/AbiGii toxin family protein [Pyrinomonadaceae bacterium]|nr:nucleotidyl transferase AbiEii/AbiGii toxin family protein [Pyrinomonadaceae bacterium]
MFDAGVLTFQEFAMRESLPLAQIQETVLEFLRGREDAVVFDAQAVNAYVGESRMTQDIDLLSTRAEELAGELREHLSQKFHIAVRVREVGDGKGWRLYQVRKERNRHLIDLRSIKEMPDTRTIEDIKILAPAELIASKVISYHARRGKPKSRTDWRDIAMLLLTFPELKSETGAVADQLKTAGTDEHVLNVWRGLVAQEIEFEDEDDDLNF